jgi:hypothetical protein
MAPLVCLFLLYTLEELLLFRPTKIQTPRWFVGLKQEKYRQHPLYMPLLLDRALIPKTSAHKSEARINAPATK